MSKKHKEAIKSNPSKELWDFLTGLDQLAPRPMQVYLIGGAALALALNIPRYTADLDLLADGDSAELKKIFDSRRDNFKGLNFDIQIIPPEWFPLPADYDEQAKRINDKRLKKLKIYTLKIEDLILSKLSRGSSKDLEDIRWARQHTALSADSLLERYRKGRKNLTAGLARIDKTFLYLMQDLFGKKLKLQDLE